MLHLDAEGAGHLMNGHLYTRIQRARKHSDTKECFEGIQFSRASRKQDIAEASFAVAMGTHSFGQFPLRNPSPMTQEQGASTTLEGGSKQENVTPPAQVSSAGNAPAIARKTAKPMEGAIIG